MSTSQAMQPPDLADAMSMLDQVHRRPTLAGIAQAARLLLPHAEPLSTLSLRIGCVASFTIDPLRPAIELQALRDGLALETYLAPFGQFDRELIDPSSGLSRFNADVVLVAIRLADVCPDIYDAFNSLTADAARKLLDEWFTRLESALRTFRERCGAYLLVMNYEQPVSPSLGLADRTTACSQSAILHDANKRLDEMVASLGSARVMDYDALVARHGRESWPDRRNALYARIPIAPNYYWHFAGFVQRYIRPLRGLTRKVLVLDADHTLWGGVLGDVGQEGIALGPDYPGNAYVAFQRRVLELYHRGVVLCLASKNQPGSVEAALEQHPAMVLRPRHFAAMRVNWEPKPRNLQSMAEELNLGIDSFVFVDDSEVECELVLRTLPRVRTVPLPREPADYTAVIDALDCFDQFAISAEDRQRGELYRAEADRRQLQQAVVDMPTFYRRLEMKITLTVNDARQIARASQMTQRTNQFNMNTRRCTEDEIRACMNSPSHEVVTLALADRFGDNGVVGLAILEKSAPDWVLSQFLMSCRVLGRTVEQAFIAWIARRAREAGAHGLVGLFVPTAKNKPFAGFYVSCGFAAAGSRDGVERFTLALAAADTKIPDWIEVIHPLPTEGA